MSSFYFGLVALAFSLLYAATGAGGLLPLPTIGSILAIGMALLGAGVEFSGGFTCRGLPHAIVGGTLGLLSLALVLPFG